MQKRKKNSVLIELITKGIYILLFVTFWGLMAIDNPQIMRPSRTSIAMLVTYMISALAAGYIFGGFDPGKRKVRDITNSLLLSQFMTDFITYLMMLFMNTNSFFDYVFRFSAKRLMLVCIILHILEIVLCSSLTNRLYFRIHAGEKCCVIAPQDTDIRNVRSAMKSKNIIIESIVDYKADTEWQEAVRQAECVVLYGVPLEYRSKVMEFAYKYDKNIYFSPDICDIIEVSSEHQMFEDSLMLYSPGFELSFSQKALKRCLDIFLSLIMIIISSPIWLICSIIIKADDHGRVFFTQDRATIGGKPFKIYKFRTMRDSDKTLPMSQEDDRVTRAGKFLRKIRMDELPQLLNVLKGDMSMVGPRPEQVKYIHGFDQNYEEYEYRLKVKAGLTGYAQIEGKYNTTNKDKLILDLMYIQNYSIWLDIKLIMQTVLVFFKKESSEGF
ncbi:MAG: exopolysaccharide biosynthesis polyprenyl glycosylphosphotransferase [Lachnospiraceae bacterium]|nr:exopolysaccharide biosynthesis polyprenyl glycosylphosphotransferase [Lachnospiraceae bacterium]